MRINSNEYHDGHHRHQYYYQDHHRHHTHRHNNTKRLAILISIATKILTVGINKTTLTINLQKQ